jgi:hypothetical protein
VPLRRLALAYHRGGVVMSVGTSPPGDLEGLLAAQGFNSPGHHTALFMGSVGHQPGPIPEVNPAIMYASRNSPFLHRAIERLSQRQEGMRQGELGIELGWLLLPGDRTEDGIPVVLTPRERAKKGIPPAAMQGDGANEGVPVALTPRERAKGKVPFAAMRLEGLNDGVPGAAMQGERAKKGVHGAAVQGDEASEGVLRVPRHVTEFVLREVFFEETTETEVSPRHRRPRVLDHRNGPGC